MTTQTSTAGGYTRNKTHYVGDGVTTTFAIGFPLSGNRTDIQVSVAAVLQIVGANYTYSADNTSLTFAIAPVNESNIWIADYISEHTSGAILPNPLDTKSTVALSDQPTRQAVATITETRSSGGNSVYKNLDDVQGVLPAFTTTLTRTTH